MSYKKEYYIYFNIVFINLKLLKWFHCFSHFFCNNISKCRKVSVNFFVITFLNVGKFQISKYNYYYLLLLLLFVFTL